MGGLRARFFRRPLVGIIGLLRKWSIQQDTDGDFKHTFRSRALCAFPMLIYALVVTFSAVDWVMALDYTWFSTMWGVYIFAGNAWSSTRSRSARSAPSARGPTGRQSSGETLRPAAQRSWA